MKPREVAGALAALLGDYLQCRLDEPRLARELRALADQLGAPDSQTVASVPEAPKSEELAIFGYWQRALGKTGAKFTADRRMKVRARLREGYTVEQIQRAIDGIAASAFHRGENDRNREHVDLVLICQNGSKLEQFMELAGAVSVRAPDTVQGRIEALRAEGRRQLKAGNTNAYAESESKIRELTGGDARVRRESREHASERGGAPGESVAVSLARGMARTSRGPDT